MNVLDATRAWMRAQCPLINRQDLFNANYLGAEPTEYTLRTASESHRTDVLGYDLAEYNLTFVAQLPFGRELKPNLDAADFFAALSAWIRGQERTHNETWELLGRGVEDASVEYNHDTDTVTDILGITDVNVSAAKPEIDLDPCTIRGGQKLSAKLLDIERRNAVSELSMFDVLHVHCFLGAASGSFTAEKHTGCTIVPQSLGGSDYVGMPMNVHLSNNKTLGTCTIAAGVPTFTEE